MNCFRLALVSRGHPHTAQHSRSQQHPRHMSKTTGFTSVRSYTTPLWLLNLSFLTILQINHLFLIGGTNLRECVRSMLSAIRDVLQSKFDAHCSSEAELSRLNFVQGEIVNTLLCVCLSVCMCEVISCRNISWTVNALMLKFCVGMYGGELSSQSNFRPERPN